MNRVPAHFNISHLPQWCKVLIVLLIVLTHYGIRTYAATFVRLDQRSFYSGRYAAALTLVFGEGFTGLPESDAPAAQPINEFLNLKRDRLSAGQVSEYLRDVYSRQPAEEVASTRILDIRLAALLWKIFGIRWFPILQFYMLLSSMVCLLIFFIAQRISGSYWAGCVAALAFAGSVQETVTGTVSLRDASPFWFASIAFFWLICLTDRSSSRAWNWLSSAALGAACVLGYGWRTDAAIIPPFILIVMVAWLWQKGRSVQYMAAMVLLFVAGGLLMRLGISALGSPDRSVEAAVFFHVADYGNATRSNLLSMENSFQIPRDDGASHILANFYWSVRHPGEALPKYLSNLYAAACRDLYWEYLKYDIFRWYSRFPQFYVQMVQQAAFPSDVSHLPELLLVPLSLVACVVFLGGAVLVLLICPEKIFAAGLYLFTIYYCVILLCVLPENKHLTLLVLPLSVLGGISLWILWPKFISLLRLVPPAYYCLAVLFAFWYLPRLWQAAVIAMVAGPLLYYLIRRVPLRDTSQSWSAVSVVAVRRLLVWAGSLTLVWVAGLPIFYFIARTERASYLHDIVQMASPPESERPLAHRNYFHVHLGQEGPAHGYLVRIRTGAHPGVLVATHLMQNEPAGANSFPSAYVTRHELLPNMEQFYYVTVVDGKFGSDKWDCGVLATVNGDAEFLSVRDVDLTNWKRPVFGTVFSESDLTAGSPLIRQNVHASDEEVRLD